jgi:hypothetical protein
LSETCCEIEVAECPGPPALRLEETVVPGDTQFSVKVGTILEDSAVPLDKWLTAMWLFSNCTDGISSCELADALGVVQRAARFTLHRIRYAMHTDRSNKMTGTVKADEDFHRRESAEYAR